MSDALQKLDCASEEAISYSFGRLFGTHGSFQSALSILLTLYIAFFAFGLLTGRSSLRVSALTPRMMTLGLVLTFVTSWVAYQSVVWNLAVGGPDEIATVLTGSGGSATQVFAQRLDSVFDGIAAAAQPPQGTLPNPSLFASPSSILSIAGLILLLGTVGVLAVCRLALAALLIVGPVFIVLALFEATRGLFEGWLKSVALFALVPLLAVLLGSAALYAISPMVQELGSGGSELSVRSAVIILFASIVYVSLMLTAVFVASTLTRSWRARLSQKPTSRAAVSAVTPAPSSSMSLQSRAPVAAAADRVRSTVASFEASTSRILAQRLEVPQAIRADVRGDTLRGNVETVRSQRLEQRCRPATAGAVPLRELLR